MDCAAPMAMPVVRVGSPAPHDSILHPKFMTLTRHPSELTSNETCIHHPRQRPEPGDSGEPQPYRLCPSSHFMPSRVPHYAAPEHLSSPLRHALRPLQMPFGISSSSSSSAAVSSSLSSLSSLSSSAATAATPGLSRLNVCECNAQILQVGHDRQGAPSSS